MNMEVYDRGRVFNADLWSFEVQCAVFQFLLYHERRRQVPHANVKCLDRDVIDRHLEKSKEALFEISHLVSNFVVEACRWLLSP